LYYKISGKEIQKVAIQHIAPKEPLVGYITMEELEKSFDELGINQAVLNELLADQTHFRTSIDTYEYFSFGIINIVNVKDVNAPKDRIAFIIRKNFFLLIKLIDEDNSCYELFEAVINKYRQNASIEKIIYGVLDRLLLNGNKVLEDIENSIIIMEKSLLEGQIDLNLNKEIIKLRNTLSMQKIYYEHLLDIGEELEENENELFDVEGLRYFRIFSSKAERLSLNTQALSENLIHLREAMDASLNYSLNKTMKVFTLVTVIFLPLTLIVGWYGMNFKDMPELSWKYGYPGVVLLCIMVLIVFQIFIRKKKLY